MFTQIYDSNITLMLIKQPPADITIGKARQYVISGSKYTGRD